MAFTATPLDGSATPVPMSSAVPDGTNTPLAVEGGPSKATGGNTLAPVATYQYDGYNVTQGAQGDGAATTDTGTFSLIALFKRALQKLTSIVTNTNAFIDTQVTGTVASLNSVLSITLPGGQSTATVQILMGTLVGATLAFEASPNGGTTFYSITGNAVDSTASSSTTTVAGTWRFNISGMTTFQVRVSAVTSGTSGTITIRLSQGVQSVSIANATALGQAVMSASAPVVIASDQSILSANIKQIGGVTTQMATADAIPEANIMANSQYLYNGGGPPLASGVPTLYSLDRMRSLQGKGTMNGTITSTTAGNTSITFASPPITITPGMQLRLNTTGFASKEEVIVAASYVPSAVSTVIPLASPVVTTGNIRAQWEPFSLEGPAINQSMLPYGIGLSSPVIQDPTSGNWYVQTALTSDAGPAYSMLGSSLGYYNGATIDRVRGNLDNVVLLPSAARTTTQTIADQTNYNARGVVICVDTTAFTTAVSNVVTISGKDPVSGKYQLLLTGAAIVAVGTVFYTIYPGATAAANLTVSLPLPRTFQVKITVGNANSVTYSVGAMFIV